MGKPNFKVIGKVWFSTRDNGKQIGIVLMNNGFEDKAYIGLGRGLDEEGDTEYIIAWGTPFPVQAAKLMCGGK